MPTVINGTSGITFPAGGTGNPASNVPSMLLGTAVASTSGTSIDFTSLPTWIKRITVMLNGVSTNGTSVVQIQLGVGGTPTTSGYLGNALYGSNAAALSGARYTTGFGTIFNVASNIRSGALVITNITGNTWVAQGSFGLDDLTSGAMATVNGSVALSGTLGIVRITTVNGTDTFDAGSVNILYEGY